MKKLYGIVTKLLFQQFTVHPLIALLLVLEIAMSVGLFASMRSHVSNSEEKIKKYESVHGKKNYFGLREQLNDIDYKYFMRDSGGRYRKTLKLIEEMQACKDFNFSMLRNQFIEINQKYDESFLYGYDEGCANKDGFSIDGKTYYQTKCLQVSKKFFNEFIVSVEAGRAFSDDDYRHSMNDGDEIPVLVGNNFKKHVKLGETLTGFYLNRTFKYKIIGFLSKDSYFFDTGNGGRLVPCENHVIMPAVYLKPDHDSDFDRMRALQLIEGIISTDKSYEELSDIFDSLKRKVGVAKSGFNIFSPDYAENRNGFRIFSTYASMTKQVMARMWLALTALIFLSIFTVSISIRRIINEKRHELSIALMLGAPFRVLAFAVFAVIFAAFALGGVLSFLFALNISFSAFLESLLLMLAMLTISFMVSLLDIKRIDIASAVKGRE